MYRHKRTVFKANITIIPVFMACLLFSACNSNDQVKPLKPLSIATGNWEPYVGEELEKDGPVAQMISAVLIELGYLPVFKYYEWGFIDTHLKTGYPGFAFPFIRDNNNGVFKYSDPLVNLDYVLFYYDENVERPYLYNSVREIIDSGNKVGRIRGYTGFPGFSSKDYTEVAGAAEGFKMLAEGKIDFLLEAKSAGRSLVMSQEIPADAYKFSYLGKASSPGQKDDTTFVKNLSFRIKFSPKVSDEFIASINDAIKTCNSTEYYRSLIARVNSPAQDLTEAYLNNPGQSPVHGFSDPFKKDPDYVLPPNTKVVVIEWNRIFTDKISPGSKKQTQIRSRVKILNGPLKGKVLWLANDQILISK